LATAAALFAPTIRRPPPPTLFPYTTLFRSVRQEAASAQAAFDSAQFLLSMVVTALKANDVPEEAIRTTGLTLHPVYRYEEGVKGDRKSTRLNSSHVKISYAVFCLKKKKTTV